MPGDHSSDDSRSNIESSDSDDDRLPTQSRWRVRDRVAGLGVPTGAAFVLGFGILGALFATFAAFTSAYWVESSRGFPIYVARADAVPELVSLSLTAGAGVALATVSRRVRSGAGRLAALVGAISISLLVLFAGTPVDSLYYDPVLIIAFVAYLTRFRDGEAGRDGEQHRTWLHRLYSGQNSERVLLVSVVVGAAFFVAILALVAVNNLLVVENNPDGVVNYLNPTGYLWNVTYLGSLLIVVELVILGRWVTSYGAVWRDAEPCIGTDEEAYEEFLAARLERTYDPRFVFVGFVLLWFSVWVPVYFRRYIPEISFTAVIAFLAITVVYVFYVHVGTVKQAMECEIENVYTAAQQLEPLAQFTVNTAFWWFVAISVVGVIGFFDPTARIQDLVEQIVRWLGPLIAIGFAFVAIPMWHIHAALRTAKNDLLREVNAKNREHVDRWTAAAPADEVSTELDAAELAYESVTHVRTWPYDVTELVKVLISSVIPITQFVRSIFGT